MSKLASRGVAIQSNIWVLKQGISGGQKQQVVLSSILLAAYASPISDEPPLLIQCKSPFPFGPFFL